ncbi:CoA-transferase [Brevibacillus sp. TJ4]|uniref:CoA-transferase n=1 Tax=Brevibacillus sp. TJ4 TaxID=3234853 RepID=UPI0037D55B78
MSLDIHERNMIARRAAKEIAPGSMVYLGAGIPEMVADFVPDGAQVHYFFPHGFVSIGSFPKRREQPPLRREETVPLPVGPGSPLFDSSVAFGIIRRGMLDIAFCGGLQVSAQGDLANWILPGKKVYGIGGGSELAQSAKKVIVLMSHLNREGDSKLVSACTFPVTASRCVDVIITERAVIEVTAQGLLLREVLYPYQLADVIQGTAAPLRISEQVLISD